jgi:hypothetical protein
VAVALFGDALATSSCAIFRIPPVWVLLAFGCGIAAFTRMCRLMALRALLRALGGPRMSAAVGNEDGLWQPVVMRVRPALLQAAEPDYRNAAMGKPAACPGSIVSQRGSPPIRRISPAAPPARPAARPVFPPMRSGFRGAQPQRRDDRVVMRVRRRGGGGALAGADPAAQQLGAALLNGRPTLVTGDPCATNRIEPVDRGPRAHAFEPEAPKGVTVH